MKAGFIGLGAMGTHMATNLARKGLLGGVYTLKTEAAQAFAQQQQVPAVTSPAALWASCDVIVLCVSNDAAVLSVVDSLAVPAARGKLVIDCSTVAPDTATDAAERLARVGARFVDAPINGGTDGAQQAHLTFMVGGSAQDCERARPLFEAMGQRSLLMGAVGSGQATKAVNQAVTAGIAQAVSESLAFATALELPLPAVVEALRNGAAGSWFSQNRHRMEVNDDYTPGLKVELHHKDLTICQQMAAQLGGDLPSVNTTQAQYQILMAEGRGEEDISSLYRLNRRLFPAADHS